MCTAGPEPGGRGDPSNLTWGSAATLSQEPNCEWEAGGGGELLQQISDWGGLEEALVYTSAAVTAIEGANWHEGGNYSLYNTLYKTLNHF